jgi:NADPH2:quinone reductase
MRSIRVSSLDGPGGVEVVDIAPATAREGELLVEVAALGISWPDLLQTRGEYQLKPELPFQLGVDFAGTVKEAPEGTPYPVGARVACCLPYGGGADLVSIHPASVLALPDAVSFEKGAAMPMNYLTAEFALARRSRLRAGETVLVHGAAGGVGTATVQVARGLGARTIAVVSNEEKARVAKEAGADEVALVDRFLDEVKRLTDGRGVDVVLDVGGEPVFVDSLRALAPEGRLLVVGFTGGQIPSVRVNRLLLNNVDIRGVGWGMFAMTRPGFMQDQWTRLVPMMTSGVVDPPIGSTRPVEKVRDALEEIAGRRVLGKTVLTF